MNLDLISDPALLQELISFTLDINADRVMALVGCIIGLEEIYNTEKRTLEYAQESSELDREFNRLIANNRYLFNAKLSKTTTLGGGQDEEQLRVGASNYRPSTI